METEENISLAHEQRFSTMVDQSVPDWLETGFSGESNQETAGFEPDVSDQNAVVLDWQSSGQADPNQGDDGNLLHESPSKSILEPLATKSDCHKRLSIPSVTKSTRVNPIRRFLKGPTAFIVPELVLPKKCEDGEISLSSSHEMGHGNRVSYGDCLDCFFGG